MIPSNIHITSHIVKLIPKYLLKVDVKRNDITIHIKREFIPNIFIFLKLHLNMQFSVPIDTVGVDYPKKHFRFNCIYILSNIRYTNRLYLSVNLKELSIITSLNFLYPAATWYEREIWDLFGIFFCNNYDLRKLLTDYGFKGHPLRKDSPLTGYVEIRYDDTKKRIVTENIELTQEYRNFI
jgi:NADH:ubiquinone oxidoreductase subunit C